MLLTLLAQVDPKTVDTVAVHVEKQPWMAVVGSLLLIVAVMLGALVWYAKTMVPAQRLERQADRDHLTGLLAARGKESERDLAQVTETFGIKLENRIVRVEESVNRAADSVVRVGDSVAKVQNDLAKILAKTGAGALVVVLLLGSGTAAELQHPGQTRALAQLPDLGVPAAQPVYAAGTPPRTRPPQGKPCSPPCVRPSYCSDGSCIATSRKPLPGPVKPSPHVTPNAPSSATDWAAWVDNHPDRPGDAALALRVAELNQWARF